MPGSQPTGGSDRLALPAVVLPGVVVLPSTALTLPGSDPVGVAVVDEAARGDHVVLLVSV